MATGIDTSNILQPGAISLPYLNRTLISDLQLLSPAYWSEYVNIYGNEDLTWWLSTFGGMEEVKNRDYFWFEQRGKLMVAITNKTTVGAAANATITVTIIVGDHFGSGTESPLRVGETVRVASTNVEGVILTIDKSVDNAHSCTIRPKKLGTSLATAGQVSLLANDILIFGGDVDAGEASDSIQPLIPLDIKRTNSVTELRETWAASDLAEMTAIFYTSGNAQSGLLPGGNQAGTSYFTYSGLCKAEQRFKNYVEEKLVFGDVQTNTGLNNSTGAIGLVPNILQNSPTLTYTPGNLDIGFAHLVTRLMRVNGTAKQAMWLSDVFQSEDFSDSLFAQFPAGAFVWGQGEKSQEASLAYGFRSLNIDGFLLQKKTYENFNTEIKTGKTPAIDRFRDFGIICPMGAVPVTGTNGGGSGMYKNISVVYMPPPATETGTVANGIRVWEHGGGSRKSSDGKMIDYIEMLTYRSVRCAGLNQFIVVDSI